MSFLRFFDFVDGTCTPILPTPIQIHNDIHQHAYNVIQADYREKTKDQLLTSIIIKHINRGMAVSDHMKSFVLNNLLKEYKRLIEEYMLEYECDHEYFEPIHEYSNMEFGYNIRDIEDAIKELRE